MFCRHCNIHFPDQFSGHSSGHHSGQGTGALASPRCPSCGRNGGATPVAVLPPPSRKAARPDVEELTRTENLTDPWAPGCRVAGKYEVIGPLGSGGFGTVYKVRHIFRKKYYALKTPHPQFMRDEVFRQRFEREIEAMERFVHPDAVMIRDCGVTERGIPYYTMDFIDGESLKAVLLREGKLSPERAVKIVRRILRVLEVAHENRIIHRDLKPDNILLSRGGGREQVKVLDFGVAKLLDLVSFGSITREGRVGTPRYMSPEQITGDPVDERSDLFALGIIFYEMVTGEHPFGRERDPVRLTAAILNRVPRPPRELAPDLPRGFAEGILWMLEKKPKKRPAGAAAALERLPDLEEERGAAPVEAPASSVRPGAPRAVVEGLVLRQASPEGERRSFLLFKERVSFGRSSTAGTESDLILRCLPCRSQDEDGENWRRNLTISGRLGVVFPEGSALVIEPDPRAGGGLSIGGVKSLRPARILADRFHLSLGDRALEVDGFRRLRRTDRGVLDLRFLSGGRPEGPRPASIGYGVPGCEIDHVHLKRASNFPLHDYFLVYRQLALGSAPGVGLRIHGEGIEGEHAVILFEGGEAFVAPAEGEVRILRPDGPAGQPPRKEEIALAAGDLYPLRSGIEVLLGSARLLVDSLAAEWFKQV